jgi:hypothetical protein
MTNRAALEKLKCDPNSGDQVRVYRNGWNAAIDACIAALSQPGVADGVNHITGQWLDISEFPDDTFEFKEKFKTHRCFFYNYCNGPHYQSFWAEDGYREKFVKGWTHFMPVTFSDPPPASAIKAALGGGDE